MRDKLEDFAEIVGSLLLLATVSFAVVYALLWIIGVPKVWAAGIAGTVSLAATAYVAIWVYTLATIFWEAASAFFRRSHF